MMDGINKVILMGVVAAHPYLRVTQAGQEVLNFRLATEEVFTDKAGVRQQRTQWHQVSLWGKKADAWSKIIAQGVAVFVEGSLRNSSYEDSRGSKRYKTEIVASNLTLVSAARTAAANETEPADTGAARFYDGAAAQQLSLLAEDTALPLDEYVPF